MCVWWKWLCWVLTCGMWGLCQTFRAEAWQVIKTHLSHNMLQQAWQIGDVWQLEKIERRKWEGMKMWAKVKVRKEGGKKCYNLQQIQPCFSFAPGSFNLVLLTWWVLLFIYFCFCSVCSNSMLFFCCLRQKCCISFWLLMGIITHFQNAVTLSQPVDRCWIM